MYVTVAVMLALTSKLGCHLRVMYACGNADTARPHNQPQLATLTKQHAITHHAGHATNLRRAQLTLSVTSLSCAPYAQVLLNPDQI
jgi:hypothetical protein